MSQEHGGVKGLLALLEAALGRPFFISFACVWPLELALFGQEERLFCIVLQLFGATAFGFILSSVTALLESANPRANETNKRVNEIKEWCAGRQMPRQMRQAIREHTQYVLRKKSIFNEADILSNMPTSLRTDIILNSYGEWLRVLERPFHDEDLALRIELALLMLPQQVRQNEVMLEEAEITCEVYVMLHGCLEAVCGEAPETSPANWVAQCLERQEIVEVTSEVDSSENEVGVEAWGGALSQVTEVLCGLFRGGDLVGHVSAAPITAARSQDRAVMWGGAWA